MSQKNLATTLAVCLMMPLLTSCASSGRSDACAAFTPVYIERTDVFSGATARQILTNNVTGKELCGWQESLPEKASSEINYLHWKNQ